MFGKLLRCDGRLRYSLPVVCVAKTEYPIAHYPRCPAGIESTANNQYVEYLPAFTKQLECILLISKFL